MVLKGVNIGKQLKRQALNLHYFDSSLSISRAGLIAGIAMYLIFGIFDRFVLTDEHDFIYGVRYYFVLPGFAVCLLLTFVPRVNRYLQLISFSAALLGFSGMLLCMMHTEGNSHAQFGYFVGLILLFSFSPMLLALNTFFTILALGIATIVFVLFVNTSACTNEKFLECISFLEMVMFLFTAGITGSTLQFVMKRLQYKDKANILQLTRKKVEVERSSKELKKLDEVKNKLLSIISHDLKGPLASIRGILRLYSSNMITHEEFKEHSKKLDSLLSGTGSLLDNLLYWSIYQGGTIPLALKPANVYSLVNENLHLHFFMADTKDIQLINLVDRSMTAHVDVALINLVLRNIISNAVKFTDHGRILVWADQIESTLLIHVQDNGVGMSAEQIDKIYEWNERNSTGGTRGEHGTGIGLIICKQFIEKHKGSMEIESALGKGTTVTLVLPNIKPEVTPSFVTIGPQFSNVEGTHGHHKMAPPHGAWV